MANLKWEQVGAFRAQIDKSFDSQIVRQQLADMEGRLTDKHALLLQAGRHRTTKIQLKTPQMTIAAVVKAFGKQLPLKDLVDRISGTKAYRTYLAAKTLHEASIGTIPPIACLERWEGTRLVESYFISVCLENTVCFKDRLVQLFNCQADYAEFVKLLELVAPEIRKLHDAGCLHNDLGNQNIELLCDSKGNSFTGCAFLDLNRLRHKKKLSTLDRARDLARIWLPSRMLETFFCCYWGGVPPRRFLLLEKFFRLKFALHTASRRFRHPLRELGYKLRPETAPQSAGYPKPHEQWLWESALQRPAFLVSQRDEKKMIARAKRTPTVKSTLINVAFSGSQIECGIRDKCGIRAMPTLRLAVTALPENTARDLELMKTLGINKVFTVFAAAEEMKQQNVRKRQLEKFIENGYSVAIELIQSPQVLARRGSWTEFCLRTVEAPNHRLDWVSIGAAYDLPRSAVRTQKDLEHFLEPFDELPRRWTDLKIVSPVLNTASEQGTTSTRFFPRCDAIAAVSVSMLYSDSLSFDLAHICALFPREKVFLIVKSRVDTQQKLAQILDVVTKHQQIEDLIVDPFNC